MRTATGCLLLICPWRPRAESRRQPRKSLRSTQSLPNWQEHLKIEINYGAHDGHGAEALTLNVCLQVLVDGRKLFFQLTLDYVYAITIHFK